MQNQTTTESPLIEHAKYEMQRAGLFDEDVDYDGQIAPHILALVELFASQGHSGYSAPLTISILSDLLQFKALTPLTEDPSEWTDVSEFYGKPEGFMLQSRRCPSVFWKDGDKTWYDLDKPTRIMKARKWLRRLARFRG